MANQFERNLGLKLKKLRTHLKFTKKEVSEYLNFENYQTLSDIESGSRKVQAFELAKFSKLYLQDISYFLTDAKSNKEPFCVLWRDFNMTDKHMIALRESEFLKYCKNYYELEKVLNIQHKYSLPLEQTESHEFDDEKVREVAYKYSKMMQLGSRPACSLERLLEDKYNIKILYLNLEDSGSGASAIGEFGAAILLNCSNTPWRRNFDLAHELFHIITWGKFPHNEIHSTTRKKHIVERWADRFASELLLPSEDVAIEFDRKKKQGEVTIIDIIGMAREYMVSTEAMLWKLVNLGQVAADVVIKLKQNKTFKKIDQELREGDLDVPCPLSARYVNLALKAYQKGLMTRGKLAEYLGVNRHEIKRVLAKFGYSEQGIVNVEFTIT